MYYCDDLELRAIEKVLKSKMLFRYQGKDVDTECSNFEKRFSQYLNTKKTILLSSGTNAIVCALFCLGIEEGDEVLIPAYTFFATAAAIIELKAVPVVVNVNKFLVYDPEDLKNKLTSKTKALIAVHMDGYPCDMNFLVNFCVENNISLIEDAAQAVGASFEGKKIGTFGSFGCFSFNVDKIISCGEGGALSINNEDLYQKAFLYHDTCNQFGPSNKDLYTIKKFVGKSMRASEMQGAMINVQLDRLNVILQDLKERKLILDKHLQSVGLQVIPSIDLAGECATTSRVMCDDPIQANDLVLKFNKIGIKTNSPTLRPAHYVWQWLSLLKTSTSHNKFEYLPSVDILSRVILLHIDLGCDLKKWNSIVESINV